MQFVEQIFRGIKLLICCGMLCAGCAVCADESGKNSAENTAIPGAALHGKMENVIFPVIEFDDADIYSVIRYLNRNSKRYDPAGEGIGIVAGFSKETAAKLPKITMSLSKIPMSEVVRYICQATGLKYKSDAGVVIIGTDIDDMQTGYFNIRGDAVSDVIGIKSEAGKEKTKSITGKDAKTDFTGTFDKK